MDCIAVVIHLDDDEASAVLVNENLDATAGLRYDSSHGGWISRSAEGDPLNGGAVVKATTTAEAIRALAALLGINCLAVYERHDLRWDNEGGPSDRPFQRIGD